VSQAENGQQPTQQEGEPAIIIPSIVEAAALYTKHFRVALPGENSAAIVTIMINAVGRGIALQLLAEDAIQWGEKLIREGRAAQTSLITPT
jgi:hypothetical protein